MDPTGIEGMTRSEAFTGKRPEAVRVWLLGGFRVSLGSRTIEDEQWRRRKAAALVKLLVLSPGHRLHREQAMDLLWPDFGRKAASNNLRQTLHAARRALTSDLAEGSRYLASEDESLVLCPDGPLWVDVEAFEQAASTARRSREPTAHEAALDLYAGDLLPADRYEEWAEEHRQRLRETYLLLLLGLARLYEERGDHDSAVKELRKVVAEEPTREEAHVGLMRVYALAGSNGEALTQYGRLEEVLSEQLGTQPAASSRALREEIAAGRFPSVAAKLSGSSVKELADAPPHNLPLPRTSFVGRERELLEVERALAMTRLLTLTGAGGSGKTRLALEVARKLVGAYPDGVWLVELAPLSDPELVPHEVARALGVKEQTGRSLETAIAETLRDKEVLVVLDNCEHLVEATATLADLLVGTCPKVRLLATSREPLGVEGEALWPVPPLSVPGRLWSHLGELSRSESVKLFVARARLRVPGFDLTPENAGVVAVVCRRLEGVPLAIELAAARIGALSAEQLAERLENSLELLSEGPRTAAPRQRTMRATLEWSYGLLSEKEKRLFGRLSVFAGGWTLEATEAVCPGNGIEAIEVLSLVSSLTDKSLVLAPTAGSGAVRYGMLEPIRQYAQEQLEESGEADIVRRRHAGFFLALAEEAEPELTGPDQRYWLEQLEVEHDNLRAALSWALARQQPEFAVRLGGALWRFWARHDHLSEGRRWLQEALAMDDEVEVPVRAKALKGLGILVGTIGDLREARTLFHGALELYQEADDEQGVAESIERLGWGAIFLGEQERERASQLLEEALERYRRLGDKHGAGGTLYTLAHMANDSGDYERAQILYEESLGLHREVGDHTAVGRCLCSLGWVMWRRGERDLAARLLEEGLACYQEVNVAPDPEDFLDLAHIMVGRGDPVRAKTLLEEGLELARRHGMKLDVAIVLEGMAMVAGVRGEAKRVARLWSVAEATREDMNFHLFPGQLALYEPYLDAARAKLGEEGWEAARMEGRTMTLEEAVEYALSEQESASLDTEQPGIGETLAGLTRREQEIAALVARGFTNRQIASELSISEHTAATHVARILKKLSLNSRSQLSAWVTEQGLSSSDSG